MGEPSQPPRLVLTTKDDFDKAKMLLDLFGERPALMWGDATPRQIAQAVRGVNCTCGAEPDQRCRTATGKLTGNHKHRLVALVACSFAMDREIVIAEEEHIEDIL